MRLYRVAGVRHALDLSGEGSRLAGGRWTPKGVAALYTSEHPALCGFEQLVHGGIRRKLAPLDYRLVGIDVPDGASCEAIRNIPDDPAYVGAHWLASKRTLMLKVPSVAVPCSWNYIVNPEHPDAAALTAADLGLFSFDPPIAD